MLLDAVQELRDAGAEAIRSTTVRVVAPARRSSTAQPGTVVVDGTTAARRRTRSWRSATRTTLARRAATSPAASSRPCAAGRRTVTVDRATTRSTVDAVASRSDASVRSPGAEPRPVRRLPSHAPRQEPHVTTPRTCSYTAEHEWVAAPATTGVGPGRHHRLRPGRARRHRLRHAARRSATRSPPASLRRGRVDQERERHLRAGRRRGRRPATTALDDTPELVNTDPYGEGWMVEVQRRRPRRRVDALLDAAAYRAQRRA